MIFRLLLILGLILLFGYLVFRWFEDTRQQKQSSEPAKRQANGEGKAFDELDADAQRELHDLLSDLRAENKGLKKDNQELQSRINRLEEYITGETGSTTENPDRG